VLIGSQARGDANERSDVDALVVGSPASGDIDNLRMRFEEPLNLISFTGTNFRKLFEGGSLFLHHCFEEGILLSGDGIQWQRLRDRFQVQTDFSSVIGKCILACRLMSQSEIFGGHYLAPYVNAYTQLKNASIFFLAQRRKYRFNKDEAIRETAEQLAFPGTDTIVSLRDIYDYSVRGLELPLPFVLNDVTRGDAVLALVTDYMKRIDDACR